MVRPSFSCYAAAASHGATALGQLWALNPGRRWRSRHDSMWLHQGNQGPRHRRTSIGRFDPGRLLLTGQKLGQGRKKGLLGLCGITRDGVAMVLHGV